MKKDENIDQMIKEALSQDEQELFNSYEEQNVIQMIGGLFQGKMKWLNVLTIIMQLIMMSFAVYCGYRSYVAVETIAMFQFGFGAFVLMLAVTILKLYHIMEMNKNAVIREVKRVELQISILASKLKD